MAFSVVGSGIYRLVVANSWASLADGINSLAPQGWVVVAMSSSTDSNGVTAMTAAMVQERPSGPTLR